MMEKELARFEGDGRFAFVPFTISAVLLFIMAELWTESPWISLFCVVLLYHTWKTFGPLVRAGGQRVAVTNMRIRGEVNFGPLSGRPRVTFSIPYSEILDTERELLGHHIKIKVAGISRKIEFIGIRDLHVLENFLANIVALQREGENFTGVNAKRGWPARYNPLSSAIHDTADLIAGELPHPEEESDALDLSPRDVRVEVTGNWIKWVSGSGLFALLLFGAVIAGAYTIAVSDAQQRFGGDRVCVTAARAYRDALPRAVNLSLEKIDDSPDNAISRALLSQLAGRLLSDAFRDDAFANEEDLNCGIRLALDFYNDGYIAGRISEQIERDLENMVN